MRYARRISVDELRPGMYVEALDKPWLDTDYLLEGVRIETEADIERMRRHARHVYIAIPNISVADDSQADTAAEPVQSATEDTRDLSAERSAGRIVRPAGDGPTLAPPTDREPRRFQDELVHARLIRDRARDFVHRLRRDVQEGREVDAEDAREVVVHMMASLARNRDALIWFTNLKNRDEYTALHSMNVCMLAVALASHIGESEDEIREMGVGALLHDVGKIKVPLRVLNKPSKLSTDEFEEMKRHPEYGVQILERGSHLTRRALRIVLEHHERLNGRGYPYGLVGNEIAPFSQLVAIADVYDAMTSNRVYQSGRSPTEAIKLMLSSSGDFNDDLLHEFVASLGAYPVGSLVELNTGEVGFVVPSEDDGARPTILVVLDHHKRRYFPQRIRNLNQFPKFKIRRLLSSGAYGVDVNDYAASWFDT